jgi:methylamine---glutamate N-methyltransferase subunit C
MSDDSGTRGPLKDIIIVPSFLFGNKPLEPSIDVIDQSLEIGENRVENPLKLDAPVLLSDDFGYLDEDSIKGVIYGSSLFGVPYNFGKEQVKDTHLGFLDSISARFIFQWTPSRRGVSAALLNKASAIEIKIGLDMRTCERGELGEGFEPSLHLDMESPKDLKKHIDLLKEITEFKKPVMVRIGSGNVYGDVKYSVKAGADAIIIDTGMYCGSPSHSEPQSSLDIGTPLLGIFQPALKAFKETNAKEEHIRLLVSHAFLSSGEIFKTLALGADGVCLNSRGPGQEVFSIGNGDWKSKGDSVARGLKRLKDELDRLFAITAVASRSQLTPESIRATTYDSASITGLKLIGYDKTLPIWMH